MRSLIYDSMGKVAGEGLGNDQIGHVAAGDEDRIFGVEEVGQSFLQLAV